MKKVYISPEFETIVLSSEDVLANSPYDGIITDRDWTGVLL